jgi:hypothetical protein
MFPDNGGAAVGRRWPTSIKGRRSVWSHCSRSALPVDVNSSPRPLSRPVTAFFTSDTRRAHRRRARWPRRSAFLDPGVEELANGDPGRDAIVPEGDPAPGPASAEFIETNSILSNATCSGALNSNFAFFLRVSRRASAFAVEMPEDLMIVRGLGPGGRELPRNHDRLAVLAFLAHRLFRTCREAEIDAYTALSETEAGAALNRRAVSRPLTSSSKTAQLSSWGYAAGDFHRRARTRDAEPVVKPLDRQGANPDTWRLSVNGPGRP